MTYVDIVWGALSSVHGLISPSMVLVRLATRLWELERTTDREAVDELMAAAEALVDEAEVEAWALAPEQLFSTPAFRRGDDLFFAPLNTEAAFVDVVRALQVLDSWHAPLFPRPGRRLPLLLAHELVRERRDGLLAEDEIGFVIPARLWERDAPDILEPTISATTDTYQVAERPSILRALLEYTIYVPRALPVEHPDEPGRFEDRIVAIGYRTWSDASAAARSYEQPIRLGIAPLAESRNDVLFQFTANRYAVSPTYDFDRVASIVGRALEADVELLFFPEMSVAEHQLLGLSELILASWRKRARSIGRGPSLRYVMAGVAGAPSAKGDRHKNFVVMLDRFGREVMRQDKLHRWNLEPVHLSRYGLDVEYAVSGKMEEDIEPAKQVIIADVVDLGRLVHLICADANFNTPGDWLLQHCRTDWLHAPIMDQSTKVEPLRPDSQWILKRAVRAASLGHNRVVVTNSMVITQRANDANSVIPENIKYVVKEVTLGVLLDALSEKILCKRVSAGFVAPQGILEVVDWSSDWDLFPS